MAEPADERNILDPSGSFWQHRFGSSALQQDWDILKRLLLTLVVLGLSAARSLGRCQAGFSRWLWGEREGGARYGASAVDAQVITYASFVEAGSDEKYERWLERYRTHFSSALDLYSLQQEL
jgi:hypothetical protein